MPRPLVPTMKVGMGKVKPPQAMLEAASEPFAAMCGRGLQNTLYRRMMLAQPSPLETAALAGSLAPSRLAPYRRVFGGANAPAMQLYLADSALATAFHELLRVVEIGIREAMNRELTHVHGPKWMLDANLLDENTQSHVVQALKRVGRNASQGKIVAEISFGGWTGLLQPGGYVGIGQNRVQLDYEQTLWVPALSKAFRYTDDPRALVSERATRVRNLRNRVAHHESIVFGITQPGQKKGGTRLRQYPANALHDVRTLIGHVDPHLQTWLANCSDVDSILQDPLISKALAYSNSLPNIQLF